MRVPEEVYELIAKEIAKDDNPVGIDAKHTHVIIIHKLLEIERRLADMEERLAAKDAAEDDSEDES